MISPQLHLLRRVKNTLRDLAWLLEYDLVKSQGPERKAAIVTQLTLLLPSFLLAAAKLTPVKMTLFTPPALFTFFNGFPHAHR